MYDVVSCFLHVSQLVRSKMNDRRWHLLEYVRNLKVSYICISLLLFVYTQPIVLTMTRVAPNTCMLGRRVMHGMQAQRRVCAEQLSSVLLRLCQTHVLVRLHATCISFYLSLSLSHILYTCPSLFLSYALSLYVSFTYTDTPPLTLCPRRAKSDFTEAYLLTMTPNELFHLMQLYLFCRDELFVCTEVKDDGTVLVASTVDKDKLDLQTDEMGHPKSLAKHQYDHNACPISSLVFVFYISSFARCNAPHASVQISRNGTGCRPGCATLKVWHHGDAAPTD